MALITGRLLSVVCLISVIHLSIENDVLPKGLKCISCDGRLSLLDCNEIEVCSHDDEVCYVEEVIDKGGEVVINAGCRKQAICDSKGCFNATTRTRRDIIDRAKRSNVEQICHHCCDTELCNMFGCSETNEIDSLKYRRCVVCNLIDHPKHCHVIKTCDHGEYCYTSLKVRSTGAGTVKRYDTGCMKQKVCELLEETHQQQRTADRKRRSYVELYSDCCKSHMCNRNIPLASDLPSRISQAYKCPKRNDAPEVCEDKIDNCAVYGEDYICHGDYIPWAKLNCNKFCKFCSVNTEPCEDAIAECPLYGKDYICKGDYIPWSLLNCRKFCNLCNVPVTTTTTPLLTTTIPVPCEDVIDNCAVYGESYICHGDYIPWAEINCRKFCNFCSVYNQTKNQFSISPLVPVTTITTTTAATTTTLTQLPTTTKQGNCEDVIKNCADYGESYICHGDYIPWAEIHCRRFCNFCSVETTTKSDSLQRPVPCVDINKQCADYGFDYICYGDYIPWSEINCRKFCNLCHVTHEGTTTTKTFYSSSKHTTEVPCEDVNTQCEVYGYDYICHGDYIPWSELNCRKFCNLCNVARPTTTSTTIPSTTPSTISTSTEAICEDKNTQCAAYGFEYICHGDYLPWSEINCRKFCNLCSDTTVTERTSTKLSKQTYISSTRLPGTTPGYSSQKPSTARTTFPPYITTSGIKTTDSVPPKTTQTSVQPTTTTISTLISTAISLQPSRSSAFTSPLNTTIRTSESSTQKSNILPSKHTKVSTTTTPSTTTTGYILPITESLTTEDLPTTGKSCRDTIDCSQYSVKLACHGEFITWAYSNCPRYCGFCSDGSETTTPEQTTSEITTKQTTSTTTPTPTPSTTTLQTTITVAGDPGCIDKIDCSGIQSKCGDTEEHVWLYENCRRTCNMCQETSICEDTIHECAAMAVYICELGISPELKPQCKKTCKLC